MHNGLRSASICAMTYREVFDCDVPGCNAQADTDRGAPPRMPATWANLTTGLAVAPVADLDLCQSHTRGVLEFLGLVRNVLDTEPGDPA